MIEIYPPDGLIQKNPFVIQRNCEFHKAWYSIVKSLIIYHCEWVSESSQLCLTLSYLMDYRVHGILQTKILERIAIPFSRGSSQSRNRTQVSYIAGRFFTSWTTKEALIYHYFFPNITYLCVCTKPRLCSFYPFSYLLFSLLSQSF